MPPFKNPFAQFPSQPRSNKDSDLIGAMLGAAEKKAFLEEMGGESVETTHADAPDDLADDLDSSIAFEKELEQEEKEKIREQAQAWNIAFFGQDVVDNEIKEIPPIPEAVTLEHLRLWERFGFKLNYLPKIRMEQKRKFPGWQHKPDKGQNLFAKADQIQTLVDNQSNLHLKNLHPLELPGAWVLADARPKPNYDGGNQEYENDEVIQQILEELAAQGVLNQQASLGNRAKIHPKVFDKPEFWQAFSKLFKLGQIPGATIRLPRVIEQNVQGQGDDWHKTDTWEWAAEYLEPGRRLISGDFACGGASYMRWLGGWLDSVGFRVQVILSR